MKNLKKKITMNRFVLLIAVALTLASSAHASTALLCNAKATTGACPDSFRSFVKAAPFGHKTVRVVITGTTSVPVLCTVEVNPEAGGTVTVSDILTTATSTTTVETDKACTNITASLSTCTSCTVTVVVSDSMGQ